MSKVYIVIHYHEYEGYGEPIRAFYSKELADLYEEACNLSRSGHKVFEMEVFEPHVPKQIKDLGGLENG